jgi:hypothetical protein
MTAQFRSGKTCRKLPLLSKLALKYFSVTASSAESERIFSSAGNLHEPANYVLKMGKLLMFLQYNLRVFNSDYSL